MTLCAAEQKRKKCARDEINGADIDVHQAVEVFGLGGLNGADVADACVVHENVEEVELREGGGDGCGVGDVEMQDRAEASDSAKAKAAGKLMSAIQTSAPARASSFTVASPMPLAPR